MRRKLIWFLVRLTLVSVALLALWRWRGEAAYVFLLRQVAMPVYVLLGLDLSSLRDAVEIVGYRYYNLLPFLSLTLCTWGMRTKSRLLDMAAGAGVIMVWHVCFPIIVQAIVIRHRLDPTAYRLLSPWFLFSDSLPFILWLLVARSVLSELLEARGTCKGSVSPSNRSDPP